MEENILHTLLPCLDTLLLQGLLTRFPLRNRKKNFAKFKAKRDREGEGR